MLGLRVLLFRTESETPALTEIVKLGRDGFYCMTPNPFAPGERLRCLVALPPCGDNPVGAELCLDGQVEIIRIATGTRKEGFEIGCRIRQCNVIPKEAVRDHWTSAAGPDEPRASLRAHTETLQCAAGQPSTRPLALRDPIL